MMVYHYPEKRSRIFLLPTQCEITHIDLPFLSSTYIVLDSFVYSTESSQLLNISWHYWILSVNIVPAATISITIWSSNHFTLRAFVLLSVPQSYGAWTKLTANLSSTHENLPVCSEYIFVCFKAILFFWQKHTSCATSNLCDLAVQDSWCNYRGKRSVRYENCSYSDHVYASIVQPCIWYKEFDKILIFLCLLDLSWNYLMPSVLFLTFTCHWRFAVRSIKRSWLCLKSP